MPNIHYERTESRSLIDDGCSLSQTDIRKHARREAGNERGRRGAEMPLAFGALLSVISQARLPCWRLSVNRKHRDCSDRKEVESDAVDA